MTSKQDMLRAIRAHTLPETPAPDLQQAWIQYDDRVQTFANLLESVGGTALVVRDRTELNARLDDLAAWQQARKTVSLVEGVGRSTFDLPAVNDPHALEDVDFAILPGEFGVAENGAVWITDRALRHRALPFITQHLALVIGVADLVNNMHQAYERLQFDGPGFGVFISGPSKTADIEQSLVIGAHGPRSLHVFLVQ